MHQHQGGQAVLRRLVPGELVGSVARSVKRSIGLDYAAHPGYAFYEDIWSAEYQLFGDPPSTGWAPISLLRHERMVAVGAPADSLDVAAPDLVLTPVDTVGGDHVYEASIQGGTR